MSRRYLFLILVLVAAAAGSAVFLSQAMLDDGALRVETGTFAGAPSTSSSIPRNMFDRIGGGFQLTDHHGRAVSDTDLRGHPLLIFFGYTQCPDVCPMTMLRLTETLELLGHEGSAIQPVFISVDPLRDTPELIADYISNFDQRFIGLTGTRRQIESVERAFAVYAKAATEDATRGKWALKDSDYLVDHTALVYLMGPDGVFRTFLQQNMSPDEMAEKIREYL